MLSMARVALGITLLLALFTACQSAPAQEPPASPPPVTKPPVTVPPVTPPPATPPATPPTVKPPVTTPSFNLTLEPTSLNAGQGQTAVATIKLERVGGFAGAVLVTPSGLPSGVSAAPVTVAAAATSATLSFQIASATAPASSTVTLEGVSGNLKKTVTLALTVTPPNSALPDVFVKRLEWGQSVLKADLRLVPGKAAVLRAFVNATQAGIAGVTVRATAAVNGATLGTLELTAPISVPTTDTVTDLASTYWGVLPKEWVRPGLEVKLEVDANRSVAESDEGNNLQTLKPTVGAGSKLLLTMVPVIVNGKAAPPLDAAAVEALKTGLMLFWPLVDVDIQVRAPYTVTKANPSSSDVLDEITVLMEADKSGRYYYGYYNLSGGIGWVGYPASAGGTSLKIVAHELGHNFGQLHAPCGGPSGVDANYPYKDGSIGSWGIDPRNNTLVDPARFKDVMGYCGTNWVSDYMYRKVQLFLEQIALQASPNTAPSDLLLVSGTVRNGQITLEPMQRITGVAAEPKSGLYHLALETESGVKQVAFDVRSATHEDGTEALLENAQFSFTMPDPGSISSVMVSGYGVASLQRSAAVVLARGQSVKPTSVQRSGAMVTVTWDAAAYSSVALAHIAMDGTRTTLALGLTGGSATLELGALGAGQFEVSGSDGLNGFKQRF